MQGSRFINEGRGVIVLGLGFYGLGSRVQSFGYRLQDFLVPGPGIGLQNFG